MGDDPGNTQPDRWGLKGKEDLGDGLSAIFQLENGFYTNNGQFATANTIWNRAAFVGLGSERYGTLTLGRQTPLSFDYLDPLSTAYLAMSWYAFHPGNIDGFAATGNVPYNNSVKYRSPTFAGFSAAATMALGNTTNFSTGKSVGVALNYANGPFKASAVLERARPRDPDQHDRHHVVPGAEHRERLHREQGREHRRGRVLPVRRLPRARPVHAHEDAVERLFGHVPELRRGVNYRSSAFNTIAGGAATTTLAGRRWTQVGSATSMRCRSVRSFTRTCCTSTVRAVQRPRSSRRVYRARRTR